MPLQDIITALRESQDKLLALLKAFIQAKYGLLASAVWSGCRMRKGRRGCGPRTSETEREGIVHSAVGQGHVVGDSAPETRALRPCTRQHTMHRMGPMEFETAFIGVWTCANASPTDGSVRERG